MIKYILSVFISGVLFLTSNQNGSQQNVNTSDATASSVDTYQGLTEGSHSVSLTGGFNYSVPIAVPSGVNGVEPELTLAYNGQSGNGLAGYGWTVSGLSTISRIPSTIYHNGYMDPVDLDHNDQFTLDGQRLILKSGTTNQYQTESFSNIKIVRDINSNSFTVYYPNGSRAKYGYNDNSRSLIEWAITNFQDANGNIIEYDYITSNNIVLINSIKYGHRLSSSFLNEVKFIYTRRTNSISSYINGNKFVQSALLKEIKVFSKGELYRRYSLNHKKTLLLNYEIVSSITEYNKENQPKPSISFEYNKSTEAGITQLPDYVVNHNLKNLDYENLKSINGDFDGDGYNDFVLYNKDDKKELAFFGKAYGTTPANSKIYDLSSLGLNDFETVFSSRFINSEGKVLSEYNGLTFLKRKKISDAKIEMTFHNRVFSSGEVIDAGNKKIILFSESSNSYYKKYISGDFNGDGITEVMITSESLIVNTQLSNINVSYLDLDNRNIEEGISLGILERKVRSGRTNIFTGDYNGDGKTDLYLIKEDEVKVYTFNDRELILLASVRNNIIDDLKQISLGDFNGDGKTDFITPNEEDNNRWTEFVSNSSGGFLVKTHILTNYKKEDNYRYIFTDVSGDGRTDFLSMTFPSNANDETFIRTYHSTMNTDGSTFFFSGGNHSMGRGLNKIHTMVGLDADSSESNTEFGFFFPYIRSGSRFPVPTMRSFSFNKDHEEDIKLHSVKNNGNQKSINIFYVEHNDGNYIKDNHELFPYINLNNLRGYKLVKQLEEAVNNISYRKQDYRYYGAVMRAEGVGFLGFKGYAATNWYGTGVNKLWNVSFYDPHLNSVVIDKYTATSIDFNKVPTNAISKEHYNYASKLLANPSSKYFEGIPVDLTLNQVMNNTFKIASRSIRLTTGFKAQSSKGQFKASIVGNPNQSGASGYAGVYLNFPIKITSYNNLTKVTNTKTYTYDSYWNPTIIRTNHGGVGTIEERLEYYNNPSATTGYYMARIKKQTDKSIAYGGSFQSSTEYNYDGLGRAIRIVKKGNGGSDSLEETLTYDAFGNIKTRSLKGTGVSARNERFDYDPSGRFVIRKTNIEGLVTSYVNKATTGLLESETNHLGLTTSYTYDAWNRPKTVTDYLGKTATYAYKGQTDGGFWVEESNPQTTHKKTYYDPHGRVYREKALSLNNNWISVDTEYDALDRKVKQSEPYISGSATQWTVTQYDQYGRVSKATAPTGRTMTTSYNGLTVSVNDQVQTKTTVKDAMGNTLSNEDNGGKITYTYFPNGNMKTSSYAGNTIVVEQDHWGRKIKLTDPSAGVYQYKYNAFGETLEEINPKGKTTTVYDVNGRITQKTIKDAEKNYSVDYVYDGTTKLLKKVNATTDDVNNVAYIYDNYGRPTKVTEDNSRATYTKEMVYDDFGRAVSDKVTAKSKAKNQHFESTINYHYEYGSGILEKVTDASGTMLYEVQNLNQRAQVTHARFGNGVNVSNEYDTYGYLTKQRHASASYTAMDYQYQFHQLRGNLESRKNYALSSHYQEAFGYDNLDRLTTINATTEQSNMTYEKGGRIKTNSIVGTYNYKSSGSIFQLGDIDLNTKGEQLFNNRELQEAQFTSFKKPTHIKEAGNGEVWFEYNGGLSRSYAEIKKEDGSQHLIKHYSADQSTEIVEDQLTGKSKIVHYFGGPYQSNISYIAEYNASNDVTKQGFHYLHRDYLGSLVAISDQSGAILEKRHYGAWGKLEKFESKAGTTEENMLLDRGWTGHEHFAQVNLVHMNGRMYDADLGRFLAPDNYVQDPSNTQNFNRYQYAFNNPLKYTDPSGEVVSIGAAILIGAIVGAATYGIQAAITGNWSWTGFIKSVAIGAVTGFFSAGIGEAVQSLSGLTQIAIQSSAHGVLGGVASMAEGNGFLSGAAAGFISSAVTSKVSGLMEASKSLKKFAKVAIMVGTGGVTGGISSVLAGENFMSGFRQGVITAGLNHAAHMVAEEMYYARMEKFRYNKIGLNNDYYKAKIAQGIIPINPIEGLARASWAIYQITGQARHLLGPDAIMMQASLDGGIIMGGGAEGGALVMLRGIDKGNIYGVIDVGGGFYLAEAAISAEFTAMYYSGPLKSLSHETFYGERIEINAGLDVIGNLGLNYIGSEYNGHNVYGFGFSLGLDALPTLVDFNITKGVTFK